ncbi:glycine/sarcosine/betaine reductase complex component C subunit alpha [Hafnia alvei]|uniref:Betaine reductase n=1 Tax=Hafnia alvei TaxID=569 RepID=A0A1C6Z6W1_HAFAL|nr:glycine/sarcosine/betaine reductase complex component C subunit alpha [Hafnia alvei]NLS55777.1 glycine reductase [Hafnia alvei]SCM54827.1 betaine reductase [Hafnia alvei]
MTYTSFSQALRDVADTLSSKAPRMKIALTALGSELPNSDLMQAASDVLGNIDPVIIGPEGLEGSIHHHANTLAQAHQIMERLLANGDIDGAVTLHYNFALGTTTATQIHSVASGRRMVLSSTTGSSDARRADALVKNALAGLAVADALGISHPTLGILNVDGAPAAERILQRLALTGFPINFAASSRADGGALMRGNDLIRAIPNVMVCDTLTGNLLIKLWSAGLSGGEVETTGCGYGVGLGPHQHAIVCIISRASGIATIAGAMQFCAQMAQREVIKRWQARWQHAQRVGIEQLLTRNAVVDDPSSTSTLNTQDSVPTPVKTVVDDEIHGIDILQLDQAQRCLWLQGIYAETGMGCTGPVLMIHHQNRADALKHLRTFLN